MELIFTKRFEKQAKKLTENNRNLKIRINTCLLDFSKNFRASIFYRKPLRQNWYGHEELQVGGDIRIIIRVDETRNSVVFEAIGTHSQLRL